MTPLRPHGTPPRPLTPKERERFDFAVIAGWIPEGCHVLDLGCGDGRLLRYLGETQSVTGYGVEINVEAVLGCIRNGIDVIQIDIEGGLSGFEDGAFSHAIISQALQAMHSTERILDEMLRVADEAIVSFPNFAYRTNREAVAAGHMPVSEDLPYAWYDTPNVRFFTIVDFEALCQKLDIEIRERLAFDVYGQPVVDDPNLNGSLAFYRLGRAQQKERSEPQRNSSNNHAKMLGFATLTQTVMAPVATPDDEKLYGNYGETPFLGGVLSR